MSQLDTWRQSHIKYQSRKLPYTEILHSDWLKLLTWLSTSNQKLKLVQLVLYLVCFLDLVFCPKTKLSEGQLNWQNQPEWGEALCLAFSPDKAAWLLSRSSCHWILCHSSPTTGCSSFQFVPLPRWWWCCFGVIKAVNDFNLWSHSGMGLSWSTGSLTRSVSHRPKFSRRIFQRRFPVLGILAAFHLVLWQW